MRRPAAPLAPSDPAIDVDLDAMYAAELPPCALCRAHFDVDRPSVRVARGRCSACRFAAPFGVCAPHASALRAADERNGGMDCFKCGTPRAIRFGGLS